MRAELEVAQNMIIFPSYTGRISYFFILYVLCFCYTYINRFLKTLIIFVFKIQNLLAGKEKRKIYAYNVIRDMYLFWKIQDDNFCFSISILCVNYVFARFSMCVLK